MNNEALMRRISAASEKPNTASARAPANEPSPAQMTPEQLAAQQRLAQRQAQVQTQSSAPVQNPATASALPPAQAQPQPQTPAYAPTPAPAAPLQPTAVTAPPLAPVQPAPQPQATTAQPAPVAPTANPTTTPAAPAPGAPLMSFLPQPEVEVAPEEAPRPMRKEDRPKAFVIASDATTAIVQGDTTCIDTLTGLTWGVGRMLSIQIQENRVVGMICDIDMVDNKFTPDGIPVLHFKLELQGEIQISGSGGLKFVKGISSYPGVGSVVHQIRNADLSAIYASTGDLNGVVGHLSQDASVPAYVDVSEMLSKHFAVLGSTGCGKSASVSLLLHCCQELVPDLRTIILDPHNEYSRAFPEANTISQNDLDVPFWMFQLEEYVETLFRGKPLVHEEIDALREFIPEAKSKFRDGEERVRLRPESSSSAMTADTCAPYRIADVLKLIDEEMGLLDGRYEKSDLKSLKARISAHADDQRYGFMFRHRTIEDIAQSIIGDFFCLPGNGSKTSIIQMAGMPSEVVNAVASVLCRLSFELAIAGKGNLKTLVVCEEAHRYVPAGQGGFEPTRRAIGRIAKEGRKYGSFMAIISQRPSELDPTILSQCSTVFSLRLTNHFDQEIIKRAISSSSASTVAFISSLSNRECIAFGEGMSTPMRMLFRTLPKQWLPGAEADVFGNSTPVYTAEQSAAVFNSWRNGDGH